MYKLWNYKLKTSVMAVFMSSFMGCKERTFNQSAVVAEGEINATDSFLVNSEEMMNSGVFSKYRSLFMELGSRDDAKSLATSMGVTTGGKRQQWIFLMTLPLQASLNSFRDPERQGIIWGGNTKSYSTFATTVIKFSLFDKCESQTSMESYPANFATDLTKDREIICLRQIHKDLGYGGVLRVMTPQARMVDGNPLKPSEIEALRKIAQEGFLEPLDLLKNDKGELVPAWTLTTEERAGRAIEATGIEYPKGERVQNLLEKWNQDAMAIDSKSGQEVIDDIARLTRQCISIHPFSDANGRTCRVWMARQFLMRRMVTPLMWSDQDILLEQKEWMNRVHLSVVQHQKLIASLKE